MTTSIESTGPRLAASDVESFESRLGRRLPEDYRAFLLRTNGGVPDPQDIEATDGSQQWSINVLLGLSRTTQSSNIESVLEDIRETVPPGYIPVAVGDGGEIILLAMSGPHAGSVVLWQWDEDNLSSRSRTLFSLGHSFSDFLQRIRRL